MNLSKFALFITFIVITAQSKAQDCTGISQWSASTVYANPNTKVVHLGILYHNNFWTQNQVPSSNNGGTSQPWTSEGTCLAGTDNPPLGSNNAWNLQGNSLTEGQFIGTTNNQALLLKANNHEGLFVNPEKGSVSIGKSSYPFYYKFEVNGGLTALTGPNQANQNNLFVLYSGNQSTAKYGQGFRHYTGFTHGLYPNGEEYGVMNTYEYNATSAIGRGKHLLIQNTNEGNLGIGVMALPPEQKLSVNGNVQIGTNTTPYGTEGAKLYLGGTEENTDNIYFTRFNSRENATVLRLNIGDDVTKEDAFEIGSTFYANGQWTPAVKISSSGTLVAKEICVNATLTWCDYVFEENYKLMSLKELKKFINKYKHLPEIPSSDCKLPSFSSVQ